MGISGGFSNRAQKSGSNRKAWWSMTGQMLTANLALDTFSIVLSLIPVVYILNNRRYRQRLNQYFLGISISNVFMILGDLADWLIQDVSTPAQRAVLSFSSVIFYAASAFVLYFFARYVETYLRLAGRAQRWYLASVRFVCTVQAVLACLSPATGAIFRVTEAGYQRGDLFFISQLVPLYCYLLFTAVVIARRRQLIRRELIFFLLYIFVPLGGGAAQMLLRGIAVVNAGVALALLFILVNIQFEHEIALGQRENELAQMRIDIMLSQIQPHFLYNALATISHLCKRDPIEAQKAIQDFSAFLRTNMESLKTREPVPFERELNHVINYLYLEQRRFRARLRVVYEIQVSEFFIPPLTLQPLVENAVRHGILKKEEGGVITIRSLETQEAFLVQVEDDGVGFEKSKQFPDLGEHAHLGIENVRGRLDSMVGGTLDVQSGDQGSVVTLTIPKKQGGGGDALSGGG